MQIKSKHCIAFIEGKWENEDCDNHPALFKCIGLNKNGKKLVESKLIYTTSNVGITVSDKISKCWKAQFYFDSIDIK